MSNADVCLVLMLLSAEFKTTSHGILIDGLRQGIVISGFMLHVPKIQLSEKYTF